MKDAICEDNKTSSILSKKKKNRLVVGVFFSHNFILFLKKRKTRGYLLIINPVMVLHLTSLMWAGDGPTNIYFQSYSLL